MSQNKTVGIFGMIITAIYAASTILTEGGGATFLSGTKIFPTMIIIVTTILSVVIFAQDYTGKEAHAKLNIDMQVVKTMGKCTAIFVVYSLLFEHIGYIASTIFMLMGLLSIMNKGKLKQNIIISVIFSVSAYFVFAKLLAISLPPGLLAL